VWAFPQKLKPAATISRFSAVKIFKNEILEKREIVAARFGFWGNAHTRLALRAP
jgi:transposase